MLKCGFSRLKNCLLKLFNSTNGSYPTNWKIVYVLPVHKGGTLEDPYHYRGISKHSCVATLFSTILTMRLNDFLHKQRGKRKVQGVQQSQTAAHPRHQEVKEIDKTKQAQIRQTHKKQQD